MASLTPTTPGEKKAPVEAGSSELACPSSGPSRSNLERAAESIQSAFFLCFPAFLSFVVGAMAIILVGELFVEETGFLVGAALKRAELALVLGWGTLNLLGAVIFGFRLSGRTALPASARGAPPLPAERPEHHQ
jgi:hypothetical protein